MDLSQRRVPKWQQRIATLLLCRASENGHEPSRFLLARSAEISYRLVQVPEKDRARSEWSACHQNVDCRDSPSHNPADPVASSQELFHPLHTLPSPHYPTSQRQRHYSDDSW